MYGVATRDGEGMLHLTVNRNKRALCLDVKQPEGRAAFRRLATWADVVLEGYRNGVAERLGIDYDSLRPLNPRLIYCSVSAFGPDGPWREKPGLDALAQAVGGLMAVTGEADGGPALVRGAGGRHHRRPARDPGHPHRADRARGRTGRASASTSRCSTACSSPTLARLSVFHETGEPLPRYGSGHPETRALPGLPRADGWIFVAVWVDARGCPSARRSARPRSAPTRASPRARTVSRTARS